MFRFPVLLFGLLSFGAVFAAANLRSPPAELAAQTPAQLPAKSVLRFRDDPVVPVVPDPVPNPNPVPSVPVLPVLTLPDEIKGPPGTFIKIGAKTNGSEVRWYPATPGLTVFPAEMLKDSRSTVVMAALEGQYVLLAYTALGGVPSDPATVTITVGTPAPPLPPAPIVPVVPVPSPDLPSADLQTLVRPLKQILSSSDKTKAAVWAGAWSDFLNTLKGGPVPTKTSDFKAALTAFMNASASKGNLQGAFPGYSAALDVAFVSRFGNADVALDSAKAIEFVNALVWSANP